MLPILTLYMGVVYMGFLRIFILVVVWGMGVTLTTKVVSYHLMSEEIDNKLAKVSLVFNR